MDLRTLGLGAQHLEGVEDSTALLSDFLMGDMGGESHYLAEWKVEAPTAKGPYSGHAYESDAGNQIKGWHILSAGGRGKVRSPALDPPQTSRRYTGSVLCIPHGHDMGGYDTRLFG